MIIRHSLAAIAAVTAVSSSALSAQAPASGQMVTLEDARRMALEVDPAAVASRGALDVAGWERRSATVGLFTPSVTATTGFTRFSEPFFNFGTGGITPNATSATIEARYAVLGGGRLSGRRRANAMLASASANELATRFRVTLASDATYYAVLMERELSRVAAIQLTRAQEQLAVARVRVQAGDALSTDSLQLVLAVSRGRIEMLRRDSALTVSRLQLGNLVGLTVPADASPISTPPTTPLPISLEAAIAELLERGPAIEALRADERVAAATYSAQREGYLPEITLGATAGTYDSRFFPSALNRSQVSINVSLPIWDGGRREVQISRARSQLDAARAARAADERAVAEEMSRAYRGYQTAIAEIQLATEGVAVAAENYRLQSTRYREGVGLIVDVIRSQVDLGDSESALVRAQYGARVALARIEALLGRRIIE